MRRPPLLDTPQLSVIRIAIAVGVGMVGASALMACGEPQAAGEATGPWPSGGRRTTAAAFGPNLIDGEFIGLVTTPTEDPALARWLEGDQFEVITELPQLVSGGPVAPLASGILILGSGPPTADNPNEATPVILFVDRSGAVKTVETPPYDGSSSAGFGPGLVGHDENRAFVQVRNQLYEYSGGQELTPTVKFELGQSVACVLDGTPIRIFTDVTNDGQAGASFGEDFKELDWGLHTQVLDGESWIDGPQSPKWVNVLPPETHCSQTGVFLEDQSNETIDARLDSTAGVWESFEEPPRRARISTHGEPFVATPTGVALLSSPDDDLPLPLDADLIDDLVNTPGNQTGGLWDGGSGYPFALTGFAEGHQWLLCANTSTPIGGVTVPSTTTCTSRQE